LTGTVVTTGGAADAVCDHTAEMKTPAAAASKRL
jgi:hypothetical protein